MKHIDYIVNSVLVVVTMFIAGLAVSECKAQERSDVRLTMYYAKNGAKTADGTTVSNPGKQKVCAVSRDIERSFPMGRRIMIEYPDGTRDTFRIADRTSKRLSNTVDILIPWNRRARTINNVKIRLIR